MMLKLILFFSLCGLITCYTCMHEELMSSLRNGTQTTTVNVNYGDSRRRQVNAPRNIRVTFDLSALDDANRNCDTGDSYAYRKGITYHRCSERNTLTAERRKYMIDTVLPSLRYELSRFVRVTPVVGPLYLSNQGACVQNSGVHDGVPVPDSLATKGVEHTDLLVFATAWPVDGDDTERTNTLAYALSCQQDQFGRPVAGHINLSPRILDYELSKLLPIVVHEVFHVMAFSGELFDRFLSPSLTKLPFHGVGIQVSGLNGPAVLRETRAHFGCPTAPFLQLEDAAADRFTIAPPHWEKTIMTDDLMTATNMEFTVISRITLAVFEDSGWYYPNYESAGNLWFGRDEGCDVFEKECINWADSLKCSGTEFGGCSLDLREIVRCSKTSLGPQACSYSPVEDGTCYAMKETEVSDADYDGQYRGPSGRCMFSNLIRKDSGLSWRGITPACIEQQCGDDILQVRVRGGPWINCPPAGGEIDVEGWAPDATVKGSIICPERSLLCCACSEHGMCLQGKCICDVGYTGALCDQKVPPQAVVWAPVDGKGAGVAVNVSDVTSARAPKRSSASSRSVSLSTMIVVGFASLASVRFTSHSAVAVAVSCILLLLLDMSASCNAAIHRVRTVSLHEVHVSKRVDSSHTHNIHIGSLTMNVSLPLDDSPSHDLHSRAPVYTIDNERQPTHLDAMIYRSASSYRAEHGAHFSMLDRAKSLVLGDFVHEQRRYWLAPAYLLPPSIGASMGVIDRDTMLVVDTAEWAEHAGADAVTPRCGVHTHHHNETDDEHEHGERKRQSPYNWQLSPWTLAQRTELCSNHHGVGGVFSFSVTVLLDHRMMAVHGNNVERGQRFAHSVVAWAAPYFEEATLLRPVLGGVSVRTSAGGEQWNGERCTSLGVMSADFSAWAKTQGSDDPNAAVYALLTDCFKASTFGLATLGSFCHVSDEAGFYTSLTGSSVSTHTFYPQTQLFFAHEIGHTAGSDHTSSGIMMAGAFATRDTQFSYHSQRSICNTFNSMADPNPLDEDNAEVLVHACAGVKPAGACVPDCNGRVCGEDGCGGSCGECTYGDPFHSGTQARFEECVGGQCVCDTACDRFGAECGPSGCGDGTTCGTCGAGLACQLGKCVAQADYDVAEARYEREFFESLNTLRSANNIRPLMHDPKLYELAADLVCDAETDKYVEGAYFLETGINRKTINGHYLFTLLSADVSSFSCDHQDCRVGASCQRLPDLLWQARYSIGCSVQHCAPDEFDRTEKTYRVSCAVLHPVRDLYEYQSVPALSCDGDALRCVPQVTCADLGYECGFIFDGCKEVQCGSGADCAGSLDCNYDTGRCEPCVPSSCAERQKTCGTVFVCNQFEDCATGAFIADSRDASTVCTGNTRAVAGVATQQYQGELAVGTLANNEVLPWTGATGRDTEAPTTTASGVQTSDDMQWVLYAAIGGGVAACLLVLCLLALLCVVVRRGRRSSSYAPNRSRSVSMTNRGAHDTSSRGSYTRGAARSTRSRGHSQYRARSRSGTSRSRSHTIDRFV